MSSLYIVFGSIYFLPSYDWNDSYNLQGVAVLFLREKQIRPLGKPIHRIVDAIMAFVINRRIYV